MSNRLALLLTSVALIVLLAWGALPVHADQPVVRMFFFFAPDCSFCHTVVQEILTPLKQKYGAQLEIRSFDTTYMWNYFAMLDLEERYQVIDGGTPEVYLGNKCLSGLEEIRGGLDGLIADGLKAGGVDYPLPDLLPDGGPTAAPGAAQAATPVPAATLPAPHSPSTQGGQWSAALTVGGAGLINGVNPSVLGNVVFFISYMSVAKRKRRELLIGGAMYALGGLTVYVLAGLGFLGLARQLSLIRGLSRAIPLATMVACGLLAVVSLYDYVQASRGKEARIALRLPGALQERVHTLMRTGGTAQGFARFTLVTGLLVALLELPCTGLVYLPTVVLIIGVAALRAHALACILAFSLFSITPLAVIFMLAYFGSTWRTLNRFLGSNLATLKLLSAVLFAVLALWLGTYGF